MLISVLVLNILLIIGTTAYKLLHNINAKFFKDRNERRNFIGLELSLIIKPLVKEIAAPSKLPD